MLVECIGLPGSGKTTAASRLRRRIPGARLRSGRTRLFQFRTAKLAAFLRLYHPPEPSELSRLLAIYIRQDLDPISQGFNLCWRAQLAQEYQRRPRIIVSDELLLHGLFVSLGPISTVSNELRMAVSSVISKVYRPDKVAFLYLQPPLTRLMAQLAGRNAKRSRYGRSTSADLLAELQTDRLYAEVLVPELTAQGFSVVTLTDASAAAFDVAASDLALPR